MSYDRFCRYCQKKTEHDYYTDLFGMGGKSNFAERLFFGAMTLGASEAAAEKRYECQECGKRSAA